MFRLGWYNPNKIPIRKFYEKRWTSNKGHVQARVNYLNKKFPYLWHFVDEKKE